MWSSGEMSFESLKAQALVSDAQYALMALTAIVAAAGLGWLYNKFWKTGQTEGKPMSAKKRRRVQAALRQQWLNAQIADAITDKIEDLFYKGEIDDKTRRKVYNRAARSMGLYDLARRFRWVTPSPDSVRAAIRERLADPKYTEAAKLPDLVTHEDKPVKKAFRKVFGAGLRTQA